jgi:hypothetical protein
VRDVRLAAKAVVWERAAGQLVQGLMTIAVLAIVPSPVRSSMPFVALALVAAAIGIVVFDRVLAAGAWWRRARRAVAADVRAGLLHGQVVWAVAFASAVVVLGHAVTFLVAARSAGVTAPASRLFPLALLALLGMVLPSVAGWGPREGVTAWVFASAGLGASRGVATAVAYGVLVLAASLPGALVLAGTWLPGLRLAPFPGRASSGVRPKGVTDA